MLKLKRGNLASLSGTLATMGPGTPYAIAAKLAYPDRPVIAIVGDGAFQMNGMNEMITVKRYADRFEGKAPLVFCIFKNQDLNQVTWEQRALTGDPKYPGTQWIPDFDYAAYAELAGVRGISCDDPDALGAAWDEALATRGPVVLEVTVDPEIPPLPPHIRWEQAEKMAKAIVGIHKARSAQKAFSRFVSVKLPETKSAARNMRLKITEADLDALFEHQTHVPQPSSAITIRNRLSHDFGPTQVSHIRQHATRLIPIMVKFIGDIEPVLKHLRAMWAATQTRP